jgi:putative ABC transport system ATP-binding protein
MDPDKALQLMDMADRADHFPAQLSGGEQQRVAIARAIAKQPRLLLCDEPTGVLDFTTGQVVLDVLDRLNRDMGVTIVLITHVAPIADLAHHVIRLGSGLVAEHR